MAHLYSAARLRRSPCFCRWYARGVGGAAARQIKTHTNRR